MTQEIGSGDVANLASTLGKKGSGSTKIAESDRSTFERFLAAAEEQTAETNPDEVALDIIRRVLDANTVDDVLGGAGAIHARDYLGRPFALRAVKFNRSNYDGAGPQFYAVLEGADENGEKVVITCGARNVLAQAWKLDDMGALPVQVQLEEAPNPTEAGYRPMWLAKAERAF